MAQKDPRVDAYIAKAAPFARPILKHIRRIVLAAGPQLHETIKWGMPTFAGNGIVCGMAAFKAHVTFGFWNAKGVQKSLGRPVGGKDAEAMGQFGRITSVADLPSASALERMVKTAAELDRRGVKPLARTSTRTGRRERAPLAVPAELAAALAKSARARKFFAALAPSHRREYVEWIVEAKRADTRAKRLATTIEWLAKGRRRNWKYENC